MHNSSLFTCTTVYHGTVTVQYKRLFLCRDIKPNNFLLTVKDGGMSTDWTSVNTSEILLKLADFGCSKALKTSTSRSNSLSNVGNINYWAPEIKEGKLKDLQKISYSRKADIWSIAVVAFECITGKKPGTHIQNGTKFDQ